MKKTRSSYDKQFKERTVKLYLKGDKAQVERLMWENDLNCRTRKAYR